MSNGAYEDFLTVQHTGVKIPSLLEIIQGNISRGVQITPMEQQYVTNQGSGFTGIGVGAGADPVKTVLPANWDPVQPAPIAAAVPALAPIAAAVPALAPIAAAVPALAGVIGVLGAGIGVAQALGFGEGGGLFGNNLLGGDDFSMGGIQFGGPGLPEPSASQVIKEWHVNYDWGKLQYYLVQMPTGGRKIAMYNSRTKRWKVWAWRKPYIAVIGKNMPSHKQITRLRHNLSRHKADARTILKLADPTGYAKSIGYRPKTRRR